MIGGHYLSNMYADKASVSAARNQSLMTGVLKIKAAIRGIQLGMNEMRAADSAADIERGKAYFADQQATLDKLIASTLKFVSVSHDRARLQKISGLVDVLYAHTLTIESLKNDVFELQAKATLDADSARKIVSLNNEMSKVARERTLPIAAEMDDLGEKIIEFATKRSADEDAVADAEVQLAQRASFAFGGAVVLLLICATMFSILTIARPMRKLTGGMLELADGNFDVQLPGLGRSDEIGDVAAAVETFKTRSMEKVQREAAEKAELDRMTAEERRVGKECLRLCRSRWSPYH